MLDLKNRKISACGGLKYIRFSIVKFPLYALKNPKFPACGGLKYMRFSIVKSTLYTLKTTTTTKNPCGGPNCMRFSIVKSPPVHSENHKNFRLRRAKMHAIFYSKMPIIPSENPKIFSPAASKILSCMLVYRCFVDKPKTQNHKNLPAAGENFSGYTPGV